MAIMNVFKNLGHTTGTTLLSSANLSMHKTGKRSSYRVSELHVKETNCHVTSKDFN